MLTTNAKSVLFVLAVSILMLCATPTMAQGEFEGHPAKITVPKGGGNPLKGETENRLTVIGNENTAIGSVEAADGTEGEIIIAIFNIGGNFSTMTVNAGPNGSLKAASLRPYGYGFEVVKLHPTATLRYGNTELARGSFVSFDTLSKLVLTVNASAAGGGISSVTLSNDTNFWPPWQGESAIIIDSVVIAGKPNRQ